MLLHVDGVLHVGKGLAERYFACARRELEEASPASATERGTNPSESLKRRLFLKGRGTGLRHMSQGSKLDHRRRRRARIGSQYPQCARLQRTRHVLFSSEP